MRKKTLTNENTENASVEAQTPVEETKPAEEAKLAEENQAPAEEAKPANVNKLFNIVSLAFASVLLFAQVFLLISMGVGIIAVDGITFNTTDVLHFLKLASVKNSLTDIGPFACLCFMAILWLIVLVAAIVGLIKAIIGIFKFVKLGEDYESREVRFGKYVRTVSRSYGNAIALIAGSLAFTPSFTGMGTGVVVLGCVIYLASSAIVILFKQVFNKEDKLDLFGLIVNGGKKLVMFMLAFLLVAGIKDGFNSGMRNIFNEGIFEGDDAMKLMGNIYFKVAQPMSLVIVYSCVVSIIAYIVKYYPLNNGKKDVNGLLRQSFITLLVLSLFFCVGDCVMLGMAYGGSAGDYASLIADSWLGYIFVSIAGIILSCKKKEREEEIRG